MRSTALCWAGPEPFANALPWSSDVDYVGGKPTAFAWMACVIVNELRYESCLSS